MVLGCGGLMKHYKLRRRVQEKGTMCPRYKAHSSCHQLSSPVALDAGEGAALAALVPWCAFEFRLG